MICIPYLIVMLNMDGTLFVDGKDSHEITDYLQESVNDDYRLLIDRAISRISPLDT